MPCGLALAAATHGQRAATHAAKPPTRTLVCQAGRVPATPGCSLPPPLAAGSPAPPPGAQPTHWGAPTVCAWGWPPLCCKQLQVGHEARAEPCPAHEGHAAAAQVQCPMGCALRGLVWAHNLPVAKWQMPNPWGQGAHPPNACPCFGGWGGPQTPSHYSIGVKGIGCGWLWQSHPAHGQPTPSSKSP